MLSQKKVVWCLLVIKIVCVFGRELKFKLNNSENRRVHPTGYIYNQIGSNASQLIYLNKGDIKSNFDSSSEVEPQSADVSADATTLSVQDDIRTNNNFHQDNFVQSEEKQKIIDEFVELATNYFKGQPLPNETAPSNPPFQTNPNKNTYETHEVHTKEVLQPQSTYGNRLQPYGYVFQMSPSKIMNANNHLMKNAKILFRDNFNLFRPPRERRAKIFFFPIHKKPVLYPVHHPMKVPPKKSHTPKYEPPKKEKTPKKHDEHPKKHEDEDEHEEEHKTKTPKKKIKTHRKKHHKKKHTKKSPTKKESEEEEVNEEEGEKEEEDEKEESEEKDEKDEEEEEDKHEDEKEESEEKKEESEEKKEESDEKEDEESGEKDEESDEKKEESDEDHEEQDHEEDEEKKSKEEHESEEKKEKKKKKMKKKKGKNEEEEEEQESEEDEKTTKKETKEESKSAEESEEEKEEKEEEKPEKKTKKHKDKHGVSKKESKGSKGGKKYAKKKNTKKGDHKKHKVKVDTVKNKKRRGHKVKRKSDKGAKAVKVTGFKKVNGFKYNMDKHKRKGFKTDKNINVFDKFDKGKKKKYDEKHLDDHMKENEEKEIDKYDKSKKFNVNHGKKHADEHKEYESEHKSKSSGEESSKENDSYDESKTVDRHKLDDDGTHAQEGGTFKEQKLHKRGVKTVGYHNTFHKDEYKKVHTFYDDADHRGGFKKFGSEYETNGSKKIAQNDHHDIQSGNDNDHASNSQDHGKEFGEHGEQTESRKYGHDKIFAKAKEYSDKNGLSTNSTHHESEN